VEEARRSVARLINAEPDEVVFTASGTEADNLALLGVPGLDGRSAAHAVLGAIEHPAVLETGRVLGLRRVEVTLLRADTDGIIDPGALKAVLKPETKLVSIMTANNVTGVLQPVAALAAAAHRGRCLFHTDAVQAAGRIPVDVRAWDVDLLSLSAHKIYGPKGVGALFVRRGLVLEPLLHGGGQERGLRPSTENVAGIVGTGKACAIAGREMAAEAARLVGLRDHLIDRVLADLSCAYLIGHRFRRLPGHVCLGFAGREGEAIRTLLALDEAGISVSSGSACSAHRADEPASALTGMGLDPIAARGALRVSLGRFNTEEDVERFLDVLPGIVPSPRRPASVGPAGSS